MERLGPFIVMFSYESHKLLLTTVLEVKCLTMVGRWNQLIIYGYSKKCWYIAVLYMCDRFYCR